MEFLLLRATPKEDAKKFPQKLIMGDIKKRLQGWNKAVLQQFPQNKKTGPNFKNGRPILPKLLVHFISCMSLALLFVLHVARDLTAAQEQDVRTCNWGRSLLAHIKVLPINKVLGSLWVVSWRCSYMNISKHQNRISKICKISYSKLTFFGQPHQFFKLLMVIVGTR